MIGRALLLLFCLVSVSSAAVDIRYPLSSGSGVAITSTNTWTGSQTFTSSITVSAPNPVNWVGIDATNSQGEFEYFQSGVKDHTLIFSGNNATFGTDNVVISAGSLSVSGSLTLNAALTSVASGFSPANTLAGIGEFTSASGNPNFISFNEQGVANRGSFGFLGGKSALIYQPSTEVLGNGTTKFSIDTSGNEVIQGSMTATLESIAGDTSGATLGVNGTGNFASNVFANTTNGGFFLQSFGNFNDGMVTHSGGDLNLRTNGTDRFNMSSGGGITIISSITIASPSNTYEFSSSSATSGFHIAISTSGHFITGGGTPVISSCGSTPNGSVVGDDNEGTITVGGGVPTSCTLTFANTWGTPPICFSISNTSVITDAIGSVSATAVTFNFSAASGNGTVWFLCRCSGSACR